MTLALGFIWLGLSVVSISGSNYGQDEIDKVDFDGFYGHFKLGTEIKTCHKGNGGKYSSTSDCTS